MHNKRKRTENTPSLRSRQNIFYYLQQGLISIWQGKAEPSSSIPARCSIHTQTTVVVTCSAHRNVKEVLNYQEMKRRRPHCFVFCGFYRSVWMLKSQDKLRVGVCDWHGRNMVIALTMTWMVFRSHLRGEYRDLTHNALGEDTTSTFAGKSIRTCQQNLQACSNSLIGLDLDVTYLLVSHSLRFKYYSVQMTYYLFLSHFIQPISTTSNDLLFMRWPSPLSHPHTRYIPVVSLQQYALLLKHISTCFTVSHISSKADNSTVSHRRRTIRAVHTYQQSLTTNDLQVQHNDPFLVGPKVDFVHMARFCILLYWQVRQICFRLLSHG